MLVCATIVVKKLGLETGVVVKSGLCALARQAPSKTFRLWRNGFFASHLQPVSFPREYSNRNMASADDYKKHAVIKG
jgi:hypothetical protein